jgi:hypothetical protein
LRHRLERWRQQAQAQHRESDQAAPELQPIRRHRFLLDDERLIAFTIDLPDPHGDDAPAPPRRADEHIASRCSRRARRTQASEDWGSTIAIGHKRRCKIPENRGGVFEKRS